MARIKVRWGAEPWKLRSALINTAWAAAVVLCLSAVPASRPPAAGPLTNVTAAVSGRPELQSLRRQVRLLEKRVKKLEQESDAMFPAGPAILVDTSENRIYLLNGARLAAQAPCSAGSGLELTDESGQRSWTFDTPRGFFRVISKVSKPVWYRPDWSFIEEGEAIPKDRSRRAVADVLGDYAIAFGNGYFIHGTLYTRLLGSNVTHGCIRVDDDMLKKLYQAARPGTPIWIY